MNNNVYAVYECGYDDWGEWYRTMIAIFDNLEEVRNKLTSRGCVVEDEHFKWSYFHKKTDRYYFIEPWTKNIWPWLFLEEDES